MRAEHGPAGGPCCPRLAPPRPRASSGRLSSGLSACRPLQPRPSCRAWLVQGLVRFCPLRPRPLAEAGEGRREAARCPGSGPEGCGPPAGPPRPHSCSDRRGRPCVATPDSGRAGPAQTHTGAAQGDPEVTRVWNSWRKCLLTAGRLLGRCPVRAAVGRDSRCVPATPVSPVSPESPTVTRVGRRCGQGLCCVDGTHLEGDSAVYLRKNTNF